MVINLIQLFQVITVLALILAIGGSITYFLARDKTESIKGIVTIGGLLTLCPPALLLLFAYILFQPKLDNVN